MCGSRDKMDMIHELYRADSVADVMNKLKLSFTPDSVTRQVWGRHPAQRIV